MDIRTFLSNLAEKEYYGQSQNVSLDSLYTNGDKEFNNFLHSSVAEEEKIRSLKEFYIRKNNSNKYDDYYRAAGCPLEKKPKFFY